MYRFCCCTLKHNIFEINKRRSTARNSPEPVQISQNGKGCKSLLAAAHVGIKGNEGADKTANNATSKKDIVDLSVRKSGRKKLNKNLKYKAMNLCLKFTSPEPFVLHTPQRLTWCNLLLWLCGSTD